MSNANEEEKPAFWGPPSEVEDATWQARRRLATALRDLNLACLLAQPENGEFVTAAEAIERAVEQLSPLPRKTALAAFQDGSAFRNTDIFIDRNPMIGLSNPMSPPLTLEIDGEASVTGSVCFRDQYEGPPGCVHGGFVAAALDQTLGNVNVARRVPSLTGSLTVHYRRPTPINRPLTIRAYLDSEDSKISTVKGAIYDGEQITAEAEGIFVLLHAENIPDHWRENISGPTDL